MMDSPSKRRCAPPDWNVTTYVSLIDDVLDRLPDTSLEMLWGPWVGAASHVSTSGLVRLLPLLDQLVSNNSDGVVHGARMEAAIKIIISKKSYLAPSTSDAYDIAHRFTNHVMACLKKLRTMKQEDDSSSDAR